MPMRIPFILALLLGAGLAQAACPKNKKEWQAKGPKLLVEQAARQKAKVEIPDFSKKISGGRAAPFKERGTEFALVEALDKESGLFLSGVLKCGDAKKDPSLASLTWVKGGESGIVKISN